MDAKKSSCTAENSKTPAARVLFKARERILSEWLRRVKLLVKTARQLDNPIVIDTIPVFLEGLAEALCVETTRETATESSNVAQEHGGERARVTHYGPEQIIHEYQILRDVIREQIALETPLQPQDEITIQKSFDKAIQESMIAYFLVHSRIREQFIATLTHDLRNPIGAMKMASELITDATKDRFSATALEDIAGLSERITKNARRAERMIQDMLDASLVQVGERMTINVAHGNIATIVLEAIGERTPLQAKRIKTELNPIFGHWDLDAFQRSIENLISNAFKYGRDDTTVTIKTKETHGRLMVSVHNEGNPIPAENLETLFQVFRRAEAARQSGKKGWGIGLALARTTAEQMGGSLAVESSLEKGTTFIMDLPVDSRPYVGAPTT